MVEICEKCKRPIRKNRLHEHTVYCQICIKLTPLDQEPPLATNFGVINTFYKDNTRGNDLCSKCNETWKVK